MIRIQIRVNLIIFLFRSDWLAYFGSLILKPNLNNSNTQSGFFGQSFAHLSTRFLTDFEWILECSSLSRRQDGARSFWTSSAVRSTSSGRLVRSGRFIRSLVGRTGRRWHGRRRTRTGAQSRSGRRKHARCTADVQLVWAHHVDLIRIGQNGRTAWNDVGCAGAGLRLAGQQYCAAWLHVLRRLLDRRWRRRGVRRVCMSRNTDRKCGTMRGRSKRVKRAVARCDRCSRRRTVHWHWRSVQQRKMWFAQQLSGNRTAKLFARFQGTTAHFTTKAFQMIDAMFVRPHDQLVRLYRIFAGIAFSAKNPVQQQKNKQKKWSNHVIRLLSLQSIKNPNTNRFHFLFSFYSSFRFITHQFTFCDCFCFAFDFASFFFLFLLFFSFFLFSFLSFCLFCFAATKIQTSNATCRLANVLAN